MSVVNMNGDKEYVIEVQNVKKNFKSYQDKASSFKERFLNPSRAKHENVQVLKGISFNVEKGEAIGLIGKNGCGKSTTLKLLTRILYPNEGQIKMHGRVSSLIELGAGFHPDMTGRENIYTNASIFGITRKEVDTRISDIIRFSELEEFIDNPVRTYSSGMYMRLAFAVAINVDADILLIDEILAVGDVAFQKKCFEKLKEIKKNGTTIVIVSHAMDQMYKICDRLIWIENGLIKDEGGPRIIGEQYLAEMEGRRLNRVELENQQKKEELEQKIAEEKEKQRKEEERRQKEENERKEKEEERRRKQKELAEMERKQKELEMNETTKLLTPFCRPGARRLFVENTIKYTKVELVDDSGENVSELFTGRNYTIKLYYENSSCKSCRFVVGITREDGIYCYGNYVDVQDNLESAGMVELEFCNMLLKGAYSLDVWITSLDEECYDSVWGLLGLSVDTEKYVERGFFSMKHSWKLPQKDDDLKMTVAEEKCGVCGENTKFIISKKAVLLREAQCEKCHASLRNSDVAKSIVSYLIGDALVGLRAMDKFPRVKILNVCSSGSIHESLKNNKGYLASEYFDDIPNGECKNGVMCVDLQDIPFEDESLDLVVSEDVFEHIADYNKAFKEIWRVLKKGGAHIFTVPIHEGHKTQDRSKNPKIVYHGDPIHEEGCKVITDFGDDIMELLEKNGFLCHLERKHIFYTSSEITDCDKSYEEYLSKMDRMDQYFKYNSIVVVAIKDK